jgi:hypothetical protein
MIKALLVSGLKGQAAKIAEQTMAFEYIYCNDKGWGVGAIDVAATDIDTVSQSWL